MSLQDLPDNLRRLRKAHNMNQDEIADRMPISRQACSAIEERKKRAVRRYRRTLRGTGSQVFHKRDSKPIFCRGKRTNHFKTIQNQAKKRGDLLSDPPDILLTF